jgi:hypothetical protein
MAKKTPRGFDPSMIDTVIADVQALSQPAQKLVADVVSLLTGKPRMGATKPVACPDDPGEDCDCGECLECVYCCALHTLVAASKAIDAHDAETKAT